MLDTITMKLITSANNSINEFFRFENLNTITWIYILIAVIVLAIIIFVVCSQYSNFYNRPHKKKKTKSSKAVDTWNKNSWAKDDALSEVIGSTGYKYDSKQDIFYSKMNAWQKKFGYCRLYDEAAAPMGMIVDCEPIYFKYGGKKWLIEFWKGQYDLTTGCEVGVYTTKGPDLNIPGVFNGTFYKGASRIDQLRISCTLKKNGKTLFKRKGRHWWLTGFVLGEYSEPEDLTMDISITLKNKMMRDVFVNGLKKAHYTDDEIFINENTVSLIYREPHTSQPLTRTKETDKIIQKKNKFLCDKYQKMTRGFKRTPEKIEAIRENAPEIYEVLININKIGKLFKTYNKIKKYLD